MLRSTLLYLSNQPRVFKFVRNNRLARAFARRFVAGETLDDAIAAVRALNAKGITASLDELGESVHNEAEATATRDQYLLILDRIAADKLDANVSVKLTALGLDISEELCIRLMLSLLERAKKTNSFVRIDMESSAYTEKTLRLFAEKFYPEFRDQVGIVLQSYLMRTPADVENAIAMQCRVRLCKGAYKEPPSVAFPDKSDVDATYAKCASLLLERGRYPGIATHDPVLISAIKMFATSRSIAADKFEFQMLYGVRRDLQEDLVHQGWRMRVYVPFGTQWYPYLMRRLAERPANLMFVTGNLVREMFSKRRKQLVTGH
jgi:proline dehydrogenase